MKRKVKATIVLMAMFFAFAFVAGCHVEARGEVKTSARAGKRKHPEGKAVPKAAPTAPVAPTAPAPTPPAPPPPVPQPPFEYTVVEGGSYAQAPCPGKPEALNGIDDDCDGMVDEDWVKSGPLQVTLWWEGDPDLDLEVADPAGGAVNVKKRKARSGGEMDRDSRSACKGGETIENIYWTKDAPKGTYKVNVNYYSSCGHKANPPAVTANVGISYNGQFFGPFIKTMNAREKATVIQFVLE